jgi:choline dehydrogenase
MSGSWDYIVIGAGSAGCALANRLTADPRIKVLLIEAGGSDRSMRFRVPLLGPFQAMGNPNFDWMILSEPDPTRKGRVDLWARGKVLGGSSSINGTIYVRGNRGDYDHWAQLGNTGWNYDSLLPYFRRMEDDAQGISKVYGKGGPIRVTRTRGPHPLVNTFIEAMGELGVPPNSDYNGENQTGASVVHVTQWRGWRWSSARGYLEPARARPNLAIVTGAMVKRIVMEGRVAVGIEYTQAGVTHVERCAGEILLAASAMNSPKLLMLSGVGDPKHLADHGIPVVQANPNVGRNLHEHPCVAVKAFVNVHTTNLDFKPWGMLRNGIRFALFGSGPATYVFPAVAFVKLWPDSREPDVQFHFAASGWEETESGVRMLERPAVHIQPNVNRSQSRGYVKLRSADPLDTPVVQPNLLQSDYDLKTLVASLRMARSVLKTKAFQPYFVAERDPGAEVDDMDGLEEYVRSTARICFHPAGSNKMGVDAAAVVDPRLRVIDVGRLRVIDSSIIPQLPSGNINAISMVIGEKGADLVLADRRESSPSILWGETPSARNEVAPEPSLVTDERIGQTPAARNTERAAPGPWGNAN